MRISGRVVRTERRSGDFVRENTGEKVSYDFVNISVLTEDDSVVDLKIPGNKSHIGQPAKGDLVAFEAELPKDARLLVSDVLALA